MIVYDNTDIHGYKSKTQVDSADITGTGVGQIALPSLSSFAKALPPYKEITTSIKRKLTPENFEFIESLGFKVKKPNA